MRERVAGDISAREAADTLELCSGDLRLGIRRSPFALSLHAQDGTLVLASPGPDPNISRDDARSSYAALAFRVNGAKYGSHFYTGRRKRWYRLTEVLDCEQVERSIRCRVATDDPLGRVAAVLVAFVNDRAVRLTVRFEGPQNVDSVRVAFGLSDPEALFGLGERFDHCNLRGDCVVNWTEDATHDPVVGHDWTYWPVPFLLSTRGFGCFTETNCPASYHLGDERNDAWAVEVGEAELSTVIFWGPAPSDVISQFTELTGRPRLPSPWALGVWKTTLGGPEAVLDESRRLREEGMGVSAVWMYDQLELETNSGWGSAMGYPTGTYEDMPELIRRLHDAGFKVLGYLNPDFVEGRPAFLDGVANGYFVRTQDGGPYLMPGAKGVTENNDMTLCRTALIDFTNEAAVEWWQAMIRRLLEHYGYDGWMEDFGENVPSDSRFADGTSGWEGRNLYPTLYHRASAEVWSQVKPDTCVFARAGYTGSNQYVGAAWPGDQHTDWSRDRGLPGVVPAGLSLGICGVSVFGPDIGGLFDSWAADGAELSTELWIRWCQFGALTPLMRDHLGYRVHTERPLSLWTDDATMDVWRRYARFHNALFPYLYAHASYAADTGMPIMRHLALVWPDDTETHGRDHDYLLGDQLLVAPVVEEGVRTRNVYFPEGVWHGMWDDTRYEGPACREVPAPLADIPVFVRAGAVLPLLPDPPETLADATADELMGTVELRLYPAGPGRDPGRLALHDGSEVVVDEDEEGSLTLRFAGDHRRRDYLVRLPSAWTIVAATSGDDALRIDDASAVLVADSSRPVRIRYAAAGSGHQGNER